MRTAGSTRGAPDPGALEQAERITLPVSGMHCAACANRIERNLQKSPGVRKANVNYATGRATVEYEAGQSGVREAIQVIRDTGYDARVARIHIGIQGLAHLQRQALMSHPLVLIVDDSEDNRSIFSVCLQIRGYRTLLAENGRVGVDQALQHRPDLILMDLMMPVMDGWEAVETLKADPSTGSSPVMAVTAYEVEEPTRTLPRAGFCALVRKPSRPKLLANAIQHCLEETARGETWVDLEVLPEW